MERNPILITGASGFIGKNLCRLFSEQRIAFRAVVRDPAKAPCAGSSVVVDCADKTDWAGNLKDVEVVVHLAARVHVMEEYVLSPLAEFKKIGI